MQNNRTLRYHFSSIRLTKIQKFDDIFWWQVCGNRYPLHYCYESNSTAPMEGNWQHQAKLQMHWPWDVAVLVTAICSENTVPVCSSVAQSCLTLCNPMNHSMPGLLVHHQLPESTQTHVHWVSDAIQPSHPLSSLSLPALNLSQHQGLFQWVSSSHEVAKVLEFQLQHQSFQWTPRTDLL